MELAGACFIAADNVKVRAVAVTQNLNTMIATVGSNEAAFAVKLIQYCPAYTRACNMRTLARKSCLSLTILPSKARLRLRGAVQLGNSIAQLKFAVISGLAPGTTVQATKPVPLDAGSHQFTMAVDPHTRPDPLKECLLKYGLDFGYVYVIRKI